MDRCGAFFTRALLVAALGGPSACADQLPDQDLRILQAIPAAKVSTDILWQEYTSNSGDADRRYRGKAIEITGPVVTASPEAPGQSHVIFGQAGTQHVRANLLDEQARNILSSVSENRQLTLRCFCEGGGRSNVVLLKSCVRP